MFESFLKPPLTFPTLTGSIVTFNSQYAGLPLKSHSVEVVATQSGSGTPSPSNPRPITGYSAINISHSDADTSNPTVYTIQIGSTVYGGEYDARTGVLTVTHIYIKPTSTATISSFSHTANNTWIFVIQGFSAVTKGDAISNINIVDTYGNTTGNGFCKATTNLPVFSLNDADNNLNASSSAADIRTAFANFVNTYSPEAVYELATPQTIQLPPCPIDTQIVNNIWADTGDTTLQYIKLG